MRSRRATSVTPFTRRAAFMICSEVGQVLHLDERRAGHPPINGLQLHALDVGAGGTHGCREIGVQAAAIVGLNVSRTVNRSPSISCQSISRRRSGSCARNEQVGAVAPIDADAPSARHVAHDRVAGHRLTTLRVANHQTVGALNPDAFGPTPEPVDQPLDGRGPAGDRPGRGRGAGS